MEELGTGIEVEKDEVGTHKARTANKSTKTRYLGSVIQSSTVFV